MSDRSFGIVIDPTLPRDKYVVGAVVVLMDVDGAISTHVSIEPGRFDWKTSPSPDAEVLNEVQALVGQAWALAAITTL